MRCFILRLLFAGILICQLAIYTRAASVGLAWDANSESNLAGYNVYRSQSSGAGYSRLNSSLVPSPSYTDGTAASGITYYYVVTAVNTLGSESGYSNQVSVTINGVPDLAITESDSGSFTVGVNGSYLMTVQNVGSGPTSGTITVTDTLPAGLTFVSGAGNGWSFLASGQTVTCFSAGPVSTGGSIKFNLTVGVSAAAVPSVTNTASVSTAGDINPANDTATDFTTVTAADTTPPTISIAAPTNGAVVSGTIIVSGTAADNLAVSNVQLAIDNGSYSAATGTSSWSFSLNTISFSNSLHSITAKATDSSGNIGTASITVTVNNGSGLVALWHFDDGSGQTAADSSGQGNTATLGTSSAGEASDPLWVIGRTGNALQFDGVTSRLTVPASSTLNNLKAFTYAAWIYPTGWGGSNYGRITSKESAGFDEFYFLVDGPDGNTLDARINNTTGTGFETTAGSNAITLNAWQHVAVTYDDSGDRKLHLYINGTEVSYVASPAVTGTLLVSSNTLIVGNRLTGDRSFQGNLDEVYVYNRSLSASEVKALVTVVNGSVDLSLSKSHIGNFTVGTNGAYTVTVSNVGSTSTTGTITVTDTLPTGLSFVSGSGTGWSCSGSGQAVTCTNSGPLAAGASSSITLTVAVAAAAVPSVTNTASASTSGDSNAANNSASDLTVVNGLVDLSISKSHSGSFTVGTNGVYTLTVSNVGSAATTGAITVSDTLPTGLSFVSGSGTGWSCSASGQTVTCINSGPLAAGSNSSIALTVAVAAAAVPSVTNTASVSTAGDSNGTNNTASNPTVVNGLVDLSISKSHSGNFTVGGNGVYTLTVSNVGSAASSGTITVTDTLPTGLSFVSGSGTGWSCSASSQTVTCTNSGPLAAGVTSSITLTVAVTAGAVPSVTNTASVSTSGDSNAANNNASDLTVVSGLVDLSLSKSHSGNFTVGSNGVYMLTVSNVGSAVTTGTITVTDTLPTGLSFVSGSGTGWSCSASGQAVTCTNSGPLAAGASSSITLTVAVAAAAVPSVTNTASVSTAGDTNLSNNTATDSTMVTAPDTTPPSVSITAPTNGATVLGTITVSGTASDNVAVSNVQIAIDNGSYSPATGTSPWSFNLNTALLSNSAHTITAQATDSSGNFATTSITVTVNNSTGPMAAWHLDDGSGQTAADSSGNSNTAILGITTALEPSDPLWVIGEAGNALQFDGVTSRLTVPANPTLNFLTAFTYAAWIYPTGWGGNTFGRIISKESAGFDEFYFLVDGTDGNTLGARINNTSGTGFETRASANTITLNAWQHVAVTYNDSGDRKLHLYINGTEVSYVASPAVKGKLLVSSNTLIVGNRLTGDRSFQGNLDELYVYNRALSASEVKTLSH